LSADTPASKSVATCREKITTSLVFIFFLNNLIFARMSLLLGSSFSRLALVATMPSVVLQHLKVVQLVGGTALVVPL
jgi:hypothetical protein